MSWWWPSARSRKTKKSKKSTSSKTNAKTNTKTNTKTSNKPSITDPPNVYRQVRPLAQQAYYTDNTYPAARPATTVPRPKPSQQHLMPPTSPYNNQHDTQSQPQIRPVGCLAAPPPNWNAYQPPVVVNNHYHLGSPLGSPPSYQNLSSMHSQPNFPTSLTRWTGSMVNLAKEALPPQLYDDGLAAWHGCSQIAQSTNTMYDRFNDIMTLIDHEKLSGSENSLFNCTPPVQEQHVDEKGIKKQKHKDKQTCNVAASVVSGNYFSKVEQYANSKLPANLPPLSLYVSPHLHLTSLTSPDTCLHGRSSALQHNIPSECTKSLGAPSAMPMSHPTGLQVLDRLASSPCPWMLATPLSLPSAAQRASWTGLSI